MQNETNSSKTRISSTNFVRRYSRSAIQQRTWHWCNWCLSPKKLWTGSSMGTGASGGTFGTGIGFECNGLFSPVSDFIWNGLSMIIPEKHDHVESSQSSEGDRKSTRLNSSHL